MTLLPELEGALVEAAGRRAGAGRRTRMRVWLTGRRRGLAVAIGALVLAASAAAALALTGQRSAPLSGVVPPGSSGSFSMVGSRYDIEISPSLDAGTIGWCESISFRGGHVPVVGSGSCPSGTAAVGSPLFGASNGAGPGLSYVLTAPRVAGVRVPDGPTVLTRADPRLPYGFRAAVFVLPRAATQGWPPALVALDTNGRAIPGGAYEFPPKEPTRFWQAPEREPRGRCALSAKSGSGLRVGGGSVATAIVPDLGIAGRAYLSCINAYLILNGWPLEAAVLLDAKHPGVRPADLPEMRPVPNSPGFYEQSRRRTRAPFTNGLTGRRVGNAWLVVQGGSGVRQRVAALKALTVGPIDLSRPPARLPVHANAPCWIGQRSAGDVQEVSETTDRAPAVPAGKPSGFFPCARLEIYYGQWPMAATLSVPIGPHPPPHPNLPGLKPFPGHPGEFFMSGPLGATSRLVRGEWLTVTGGSGASQQEAVLRLLTVKVRHSATQTARNR